MIETVLSSLIVAAVVGAVTCAFTKPNLYHQKVYPLLSKLGLLISVFALGMSTGSGPSIDKHTWVWVLIAGFIFQLGSLALSIITHDLKDEAKNPTDKG